MAPNERHTKRKGLRKLTLKVLYFWKFTSYCNLKPLWSGMGEVVPARTSPTLHPPFPPTTSIVTTSTLRVKLPQTKDVPDIKGCEIKEGILLFHIIQYYLRHKITINHWYISMYYKHFLACVSIYNLTVFWRQFYRKNNFRTWPMKIPAVECF